MFCHVYMVFKQGVVYNYPYI